MLRSVILKVGQNDVNREIRVFAETSILSAHFETFRLGGN